MTNNIAQLQHLKTAGNLCWLMREIQPDFPASVMHCLLVVMMEEGISPSTIADKLDMAASTCSRNVRVLTGRAGPTREGHGLVELRLDPTNYRMKRAYLTPAGRAIRDKLVESMRL